MLDENKWAQPQDIEEALQVFPADVRHLMPDPKDVPDEFDSWSNPWNRWASMVFSSGINGETDHMVVWPREDVDPNKAFTHLHTILGSFQPKHEHKLAGVAYLASRWYSAVANREEFEASGKTTPGS